VLTTPGTGDCGYNYKWGNVVLFTLIGVKNVSASRILLKNSKMYLDIQGESVGGVV